MKKLFVLSLVLGLVSITASAQKFPGERLQRHRMEQRFNDGQLTRPERFRLLKDHLRYKMAERRALRDGFISPMEHRRLMMLKRHERRQLFFFRHNRPRRVI